MNPPQTCWLEWGLEPVFSLHGPFSVASHTEEQWRLWQSGACWARIGPAPEPEEGLRQPTGLLASLPTHSHVARAGPTEPQVDNRPYMYFRLAYH